MNKLKKEQIQERDRLLLKASQTEDRLYQAIYEYEDVLFQARSRLQIEIDKYNVLQSEVATFMDGIGSNLDDRYQDRSERWMGSPAGMAYGDWAESWMAGRDIEIAEMPKYEPVDIYVDMLVILTEANIKPEEV